MHIKLYEYLKDLGSKGHRGFDSHLPTAIVERYVFYTYSL